MVGKGLRIGVLALQGAFSNHIQMLHELGASTFEIRQLRDLSQPFDGLILPGGESTVQGKLLHELGLFEPLKKLIENGLPVYGTCAGLIMLASHIASDRTVHFGLMDVVVKRNAFGRQLDSFIGYSYFKGIGPIEMPFIRAPYIESIGPNVEILAEVDGHIVAAREGTMFVTAYHPEVTADTSTHTYFLDMVNAYTERQHSQYA